MAAAKVALHPPNLANMSSGPSRQKPTVQQTWQECEALAEELSTASMTAIKNGGPTPTSWSILDLQRRKRLMDLLERILLEDLSYGLSKGAEQTLWNVCYKEFIDVLQARLRQRKTELDNAFLQEFLSSCLGSLSQLLTLACIAYDLEVPGFRSQTSLGILTNHWPANAEAANRRTSLKVLVEKDGAAFAQFCLVHLGDIYRYQRHLVAAESSYVYAAIVAPTSGHPWNQLGILETSRGDQVSAAYFYTRALHVENAFAPAAANLEKYYSHLNSLSSRESSSDNNPENYGQTLMKFHARIHHCLRPNSLPKDLHVLFDDFKPVLSSKEAHIDPQHALQGVLVGLGNLWRLSSEFSEDFVADGVSEAEWTGFKLVCRLVQNQLTGLVGFCVDKLEENSDDVELMVLDELLPVLNPIFQTVSTMPNLYKNAIFNGGTSRGRYELYTNLSKLLQSLEIVKDKNVRPWDCHRLKTLAEFALTESGDADGQKYWNSFWKEECPSAGLKTMPLPENLDLRSFLPVETTAHKGLKFEEWPLDMVTNSFVRERRLLMLVGRIREILGSECEKENGEGMIEIEHLKDWQWIKEHLSEIPEDSPDRLEFVEKPTDESSKTPLSASNGSAISENSTTTSSDALTKGSPAAKLLLSENVDRKSPVSVRKTKVLPLIKILGRRSSEGTGGGSSPSAANVTSTNPENEADKSSVADVSTDSVKSEGEEQPSKSPSAGAKGLLKVKLSSDEETKDKKPEENPEDSKTPPVAQQQPAQSVARPKQPLAPRFQAAKLKQALTGVRGDSPPAGTASSIMTSMAASKQQGARAGPLQGPLRQDWPLGPGSGAFPPLPGSDSGRKSAEIFRPPTPLGGTTPDPLDLTQPPSFPRTPGTRFRVPPPFMLTYPPGMRHMPPGPPPGYPPPRGPPPPMGGRGMPHVRSGPPPGMVPPPGFRRSPPPGAHMQGFPPGGPYGHMASSQPIESDGRQFWNRSPPHNMMYPTGPPRLEQRGGPPPPMVDERGDSLPPSNWENNVLFSKPNDPYFQLWQSGGGIDSVAGNSNMQQIPVSLGGNNEVWGSGSNYSSRSGGPSVFEASNRGIGIEHFPFTAPIPGLGPRMRPPNEFLVGGSEKPRGSGERGFSLFGGPDPPPNVPYPAWSHNDGNNGKE